jgi:hypothetical protein
VKDDANQYYPFFLVVNSAVAQNINGVLKIGDLTEPI